MKAARFDYVRPPDVADALAALSHADNAKLIAGGQSLGPMLNLRLARPALLVDISRLAALQQVEDRGAAWRIGAGVTHARLEDAVLPDGAMLRDVAAGIAYRSVRNRGTIGGSLAHADPAADWPVALCALGAAVNIRGQDGARSMAVERFVVGAFTTALGDNEIIESIDVPKLADAARHGYYKFCRKPGEFAEASAAVVLDPASGTARIFLGALTATPQPLVDLAQRVARAGAAAATDAVVAEAVTQAVRELDPVERRLAAAVVRRALQQALRQEMRP